MHKIRNNNHKRKLLQSEIRFIGQMNYKFRLLKIYKRYSI